MGAKWMCIAAALLSGGAANAQLTYLSQERSVVIDVGETSYPFHAPDFEDVQLGGSALSGGSQAVARLASGLHLTDMGMGGDLGLSPFQEVNLRVEVLIDVVFRVDELMEYRLEHGWYGTLSQGTAFDSTLMLNGPGIALNEHFTDDPESFVEINTWSGVLLPGEYRFFSRFTAASDDVHDLLSINRYGSYLFVPAGSSILAFAPVLGLVARRRRR